MLAEIFICDYTRNEDKKILNKLFVFASTVHLE